MPPKRTSTRPAQGRRRAQFDYPKPLGPCERCGLKEARVRHHVSGDTLDNRRENLQFLCDRCHMVIDGRLEAARAFLSRYKGDACPAGHPYTPGNTYLDPQGRRNCRTCRREAGRRYDLKRRLQRP